MVDADDIGDRCSGDSGVVDVFFMFIEVAEM